MKPNLPRFIRRWWLQRLRDHAQDDFDDGSRWLKEAPAKLLEIGKFIEACDTDLRLLDCSETTYSARKA